MADMNFRMGYMNGRAKRNRTVGAVGERSEREPDRVKPSSNDCARFLIQLTCTIKIVRGHRPRLQLFGGAARDIRT